MSTAPPPEIDASEVDASTPPELSAVAQRIARDPEVLKALLATSSLEELVDAMTALAGAEAREVIGRHVERVYAVEVPYSFAKPKIDLALADIRGLAKWRILGLWLAAALAGLLDTPPLGGWAGVLRRPFLRPEPGAADSGATVLGKAELAAMRGLLEALGEETWRLHVDWEDQDFGPEVYDQGLHGGWGEPGYLENALAMQRATAETLGRPLDGAGYERLQNTALGYRGAWAVEYDFSPRHLTRHWSRADGEVLAEISPRHYRRIRHRAWEVAAFDYLYGDDMDGFIADNPVIAEILMAKHGPKPPIGAKLLDEEFLRMEVSLVEGPRRPETVRAMIDARLAAFGAAMAGIDPGDADARLLEIARLHRWFEYLHPFRDGNTRLSLMVLNKLLVEHGFVPVVLAQRNDAPFNGDREWRRYIVEGMERWRAIRWLADMALLDHVIAMRPAADVERRLAARRGRK